MLKATLSYNGNLAADHLLDGYDAAQAIVGFQRTLALTTNLVITGEIITQAPSLKGADIYLGAPELGSLKIPAYIVAASTAFYSLGSLERNNPLGHLIYSAYDYVVSEGLGFNVDYEKSLGQSYEELRKSKTNNVPILDQSRFDSLIEKCEPGLLQIHRPIIHSQSATTASISFSTVDESAPVNSVFDTESYDFLHDTRRDDEVKLAVGKVSSYNINTFKGRFYCVDEKRPIPFELSDGVRGRNYVRKITESLSQNAINRDNIEADIVMKVYRNLAKSGRLKSYYVVDVFSKKL